MIKIRVLGKGLIPRGYGLAPRYDPFNADLNLIQLLLNTRGLIPEYFNPADNKYYPLTKVNFRRVSEDLDIKKQKPVISTPASPKEKIKEEKKEEIITKEEETHTTTVTTPQTPIIEIPKENSSIENKTEVANETSSTVIPEKDDTTSIPNESNLSDVESRGIDTSTPINSAEDEAFINKLNDINSNEFRFKPYTKKDKVRNNN